MAHIINIPVAFEFKRTPAKWEVLTARVVGWWRREDERETVDSQKLLATVKTSEGVIKRFELPIGWLPDDVEALCTDAFLEDENSDQEVETFCALFRPSLLVRSAGKSYYTDSEMSKQFSPVNAWQLRDEFLRTELNNDGAISFLSAWGAWSLTDYVLLSELVSLQRLVRKVLLGGPKEWFSAPEGSGSLWGARGIREYPYFAIRTNLCAIAIRMTVTVDLLRRSKFKTCARRDCPGIFEIESKHKRKYCSQYCGHLESVRRNRRQQAAEQKKTRSGRGYESLQAR